MEIRMQRLLGDTAKLDRMQFREMQKDERERHLVMIKTTAMPTLKPTLRRPKDEKCGKCNVDKKTFITHDDWFLEPIDALTMEIEPKGSKDWAKIKLLRKLLSLSMNALVVHPAQIKMLKNLENEGVPVIFVMKSESFSLDGQIVNSSLILNLLSAEVVEKSQGKEEIIEKLNKGGNIIVELESFEKLVVKKKRSDVIDSFEVPAYKTPDKSSESSKKLSDKESSENLQVDENFKKFLDEKSSEKLPDKEISENLQVEENFKKLFGEKSSEKLPDKEISENLQVDENFKKLLGEKSSEKLPDKESSENLRVDENFRKLLGEKSSEMLPDKESSENLRVDENFKKLLGEKAPEKLVKSSKNILNVKSPEKLRPLIQEPQKLPSNVHFVPVTINYEKLSAENSLNWRTKNKLGIVKINFHEPYTVNDVLKKNDAADFDKKLQAIEDHLKHDLAMKRPVMSTNVVAFLLLTNFRDGISTKDLETRLDQLRNEPCNIDFGFEGESKDVVEHAIKILGELVDVQDETISPKNFSELSRYAEVLTPHYALESFLVVAALGLKRIEKYVDFESLLQAGKELCELLVFDIPLKKPCEDFTSQLDLAFDRCSLRSIMSKPESKPIAASAQRAQRIARMFDDSDEDDMSMDDGYQIHNPFNEVSLLQGSKETDNLKNVTMPILEAYLTVACSLNSLWTPKGIRISCEEFLEASMKAMREECEDQNCVYWESCSERWMRNCLKVFEQQEAIEIKDNHVAISPNYVVKQSIRKVIGRIERFFDFTGSEEKKEAATDPKLTMCAVNDVNR